MFAQKRQVAVPLRWNAPDVESDVAVAVVIT